MSKSREEERKRYGAKVCNFLYDLIRKKEQKILFCKIFIVDLTFRMVEGAKNIFMVILEKY
jgi:hypothetical protein